MTVDPFRFFAGCVRAQEGALSDIDETTVANHYHEPLGVVGSDHRLELPPLEGGLEAGPGAGPCNCVVLKPAESTPISILIVANLTADLLFPGGLNIVNRYGREAGPPLACSKRTAKSVWTDSTSTGRVIAQAAASNLIPATLELGGKSPNIFFADVMDKDDGILGKAIEGLVLFACNQGEVCTCPSRALISPVQTGRRNDGKPGILPFTKASCPDLGCLCPVRAARPATSAFQTHSPDQLPPSSH